MEFEYQLFDNKMPAFLDTEAHETNDNVDDENSEQMKTFYCNQPGCKKNFRYRSEIQRHLVTHTNKRPYVCNFKNCMKGFKRSDALATHMRIHTREKIFECPYLSCKSTFSTKAGLKYHTLKHKTEKRDFTKNEFKDFAVVEQEHADDFSHDFVVNFNEEPVVEHNEHLTFRKHYSHGSNGSGFDNTHVQQIMPINFGSEYVSSERNESESYQTNYSTPSNPTLNTSEVDGYFNYHFTTAPQNVASCAANLINFGEDPRVLLKAKALAPKSETSDKIIDMMQKIIEENSNLKKKLDLYQSYIRSPQVFGDEQTSLF
jgi:uncharacterized Zn-finger protein